MAPGHDGAATDLNRITAARRHLLTLVSDILDLSKIEANRLDLESRAVDLVLLVQDVAATCGRSCREICRRLGGDVVVASVQGKGSTFRAWVRSSAAPAAPAVAA